MPRRDAQRGAESGQAGEVQASAVPAQGKAKKRYAYKAKKANGKNATGNPDKYDVRFPAIAEKACEIGATNEELAGMFQVRPETISQWVKKYPDLNKAIKMGRDVFDSGLVRTALRNRAIGYEYTETSEKSLTVVRGRGEDKVSLPAIERTVTRKQMAPDVTACIFWLVNRQPEEWKHVSRTIVQGDPKNPVNHKYEFDLSKLPAKELEQLESIIAKAREQKAAPASASGPSGTA